MHHTLKYFKTSTNLSEAVVVIVVVIVSVVKVVMVDFREVQDTRSLLQSALRVCPFAYVA